MSIDPKEQPIIYRANALPDPSLPEHEGVWLIKKPIDSKFRIYIINESGNIIEINAITDQQLNSLDISNLTDTTNLLFSKNYNDLFNKPSIPESTSGLINDSGFITIDDMPDMGDYVPYSDVTDTPTADKVVQYSGTGNVNTNTATTPTQAVNLGQMTLQGVLDNNNVADEVSVVLTGSSGIGQYTVDGLHVNSGNIGMSASVSGKGFLYSSGSGRVHLGDKDGVVGLNFEDNTYKNSIIPPTSLTGNFNHTLQNKSGVLAHLDDIGDVPDGSVTNAKLANMPANSIKGRAATSAGAPSDIAIAASRLVGRGATGNVGALTVGGGLSFSGTQLISDIYRDNYQTTPEQTQDVWVDDSPIFKITFVGTSTGVEHIDLTSFGIDSIISIEGMYVEKDNDREVPCNYQRLLTPATNTDMEVTTCYRNSSMDRLYLSWHDVLSGTARPLEFTYKVTIKYVKS